MEELESLLDALESRPDRTINPGGSGKTAKSLCAGFSGFESGYTWFVGAELRSTWSGWWRALTPSCITRRRPLRRMAAAPMVEDLHRVSGGFSEALGYFALSLLITLLGPPWAGWRCDLIRPPLTFCFRRIIYAIRGNAFTTRSKERRDTGSAQIEAAYFGQLIRHNIQVALLAAALGVTFGIGTALLLFENGVLLGAVAVRYTDRASGFLCLRG